MRGPYSVLQHGAEVRPFLVGEVRPYGANMAFRSSALKNFRFDTRLGPIQTQVLPADGAEFVTRLRSAGHRGVWVGTAKVRFELLSPSTQQGIRLRLHGPERPRPAYVPRFHATDNIIAAQARKVAHSSDKAMRMLGYTAPISYSEGMALTREWLHSTRVIQG